MTSGKPRKADVAEQLMFAGRDCGTAALMFHQAVADRLGLNTTDHKCLELLQRQDQATAGDLADWTGLTTGAVTGIIDRLEKNGFVRREPHPSDRRKVVVRVVREKLPEVFTLFQSLAGSMQELFARYSGTQLETILDYQLQCAEIFRRESQRLQAATSSTPVLPSME